MSKPVRMELMPGVWLTAIQTRKFKSSFWSAVLLTPLAEETAAMAALLPRVLNRGTARYPDQQRLSATLDQLYGGVVSPMVTKLGDVQATGFQATFLDDPYALDGLPISRQAAELLGDLLLRPATKNGRLRGDYVDSERSNLVSEIKAQSNDKMRYAALRLVQEMCKQEAYGVDRLGSLKQAEMIRVAKLDKYYRTLLQESPMELYYCGSTAPDQIAQCWVESLMGLPRKSSFLLPETQIACHPDQVGEVVDREDVTQAKLALGIRTQLGLSHPDWPALSVANALLGGAPTSKLFQNVREKQSLCYYAMSAVDKHKGILSIHSGVALDKADQAKQEILAQLDALKAGDFSVRDLDSARRYVLNQLISAADSHGGLYSFYLDQSRSEHPVTLEEQIELVRQVQEGDVTRVAKALELDTVYLLTGKEAAHGET